MNDPLDLDALEVVANAATAGPWWTGVGLGSFQYTVEGLDADFHLVAQRLIHPDATHVANFDPPTVLALIAALKEARAGLADAWDEGCVAGRNREHHTNMTREQAEATWPNPYRRTETP